ncbi:carbohydrate ABC transporter permease [Neobacillus vireti]|uniref:Binding-protein-dependent transporters inner membrane component n=1 Tax=Neobacillus vireti LMG 21834 TaxID=1131730 RepID=A0AB94ISS5_9BACI|nr:sugar ABC transporter permease [Neobacillus vireti]ETI70160.1 binding-protein-dependent transporters inner membrane component [Neobacillus vireti LMG 21834]
MAVPDVSVSPEIKQKYDRIYQKQWQTALLFLLPYLIVFILFRLGPGIAGLLTSFTSWQIIGTPEWVGTANFEALMNDKMFWIAFKNTLFFLSISAPVMVIGALALAILINQPLAGKVFARTVIFAPYVVMATVVGIIWNWIYDKNLGLLNYYLKFLGVGNVEWLTSSDVAMFAIAITTVWWLMGYNMILFLAGLQGIPEDLYEAAVIDGATAWKKFIYVTLPLLKPTFFLVVMLTVINCFQVFDQVYVMTGGGPGTSTLTIVQYLYFQAFQNFNLGYGSAIGFVIFIVLVIFALIQKRIMREEA